MTNIVYIASSLDGYIADKDGGLDWLHSVPNPDHSDFGWADFMAGIDALVMGRTTFDPCVVLIVNGRTVSLCSFSAPP